MGSGTRHKKGKKYRAGQYGQENEWLNTQAAFDDFPTDADGMVTNGGVDTDGAGDEAGGAYTKDVQGFFVQQGYDLGNSGTNKDGVDGDFGKKSKAAWNSYHEYVEQNFQDGIYEGHDWTKHTDFDWSNPSEAQRKAALAAEAGDGAGGDPATEWVNNSAWWEVNRDRRSGSVDVWTGQVMALDEKARQAGYENFRDMVLKNREAAAKLLLEEQDNAILNAIEAGEPGWFGKTVDWFAGIWEGFQRGVHAADGWLKTAEEWWGNEMMNVTNPFQVKGANTFRQQTGPDTQILWSYNPNFPIDGSNAWLRTLSPFTIRLVPPMVYLANPDVLNKTETSTFDSIGNIVPIRLGVYDQTASSPDSFGASARKKAGASRGPSSTLGNISTSTNQKHSITSGGRPMSTAPHVSGTTPDTTVEPALTDLTVATQLSDQLDNILNAPPLHLLINPESFSISYSKIQQFQERSRFGYIFQAWGEQQPVISFSGRIGAYYSKGSGVQFATKRNSAAFQNLMALFNYYKNNGYLYDTISNSEAHLHVGLVAIDYDQFTYFGNFNSFGWGYEEAYHGGGISFEMEFNVVQMFDNTGPNDNLMVNPMDSPILDPMNIRNQGYDFTNATSRSASSPKLSPDMEQGGWGKKDAAPPKIYTAAITEPASVPYTGTPDGDIPTPTYSTERLSPNDKGFERVAESTETSAPESLESGYFIRGRRV